MNNMNGFLKDNDIILPTIITMILPIFGITVWLTIMALWGLWILDDMTKKKTLAIERLYNEGFKLELLKLMSFSQLNELLRDSKFVNISRSILDKDGRLGCWSGTRGSFLGKEKTRQLLSFLRPEVYQGIMQKSLC